LRHRVRYRARQGERTLRLDRQIRGYGFNKSHAAAYALLAYQTAWFKAHYPHEFYAAAMCFDMHQSEKLAIFVDDMRRNGFAIAGPCMNHSEAEFTVEETPEGYAVRYALAGIRNVGEKAMEQVVADREARGPFKDLEDLFTRVPYGALNRRALEGLAASGAFDMLEPNRAKVMANADMLLACADEAERTRTSGQGGLFAAEGDTAALRLVDTPAWSRQDQMAKERENFGFYFAAHPVAQWHAIASANGARSYGALMAQGAPPGGRANAVMACMVESVQKRKPSAARTSSWPSSRTSGQFSASCFEEALVEPFLNWAKESTCILLTVELDSPSPEEPRASPSAAASP
jgi:DNA polymerase-3 subunit alpha